MTVLPIRHLWNGKRARADEAAAVQLIPLAAGLGVRVLARHHRDPLPAGAAGPTAGLWNHEVVELFVAGSGSAETVPYLEIELGPGGHHLVLRLQGIRHVVEQAMPMAVQIRRRAGWWVAEAHVPEAWLPASPRAANAYAIHGVGPGRRYLAHAPLTGAAPDFHQPSCFVDLPWPPAPIDHAAACRVMADAVGLAAVPDATAPGSAWVDHMILAL